MAATSDRAKSATGRGGATGRLWLAAWVALAGTLVLMAAPRPGRADRPAVAIRTASASIPAASPSRPTRPIEQIRIGDVVRSGDLEVYAGAFPGLSDPPDEDEEDSSLDDGGEAGDRSGSVWIAYPPDGVAPDRLAIEVTRGTITAVDAGSGVDRRHGLVGSRYVVGDLDATDITPALWRSLDLELPEPGGTATISVARPRWWIERAGAGVGKRVNLNLDEIRIAGEARVIRVGGFDRDSRSNPPGGQIVTGTIRHENAEVWDLVFDGDEGHRLGVTAVHPLFSDDRGGWATAGDLKVGEWVRTLDGRARLGSKTRRPACELVYNIEVHRSHFYHVSNFLVVAHNNTIGDNYLPPLKPMQRSDMSFSIHTDAQGREVKWYGQERFSSSKTQHGPAKQIVENMIESGNYESVVTQRSARRATGLDKLGKNAGDPGRLEPDIIGLRRDGRVDMYEVASESQNNPAGLRDLQAKLNRLRDALPPERRGEFGVINPFK